MIKRQHDKDSAGFKIWLSDDEVAALLEQCSDLEVRIAIELGVRCGLRSSEILTVAPKDVVDTDAGWMLRVPAGKGEKYRETPMPESLALRVLTLGDMRDEDGDVPVITVASTRSLRRWITHLREALADRTGDDGWLELTMHDLRRTWATNCAEAGVDPLLVIDWGGWSDLETFLEHYKGVYSPAAQRKNRAKVDWL
jgi:integrase